MDFDQILVSMKTGAYALAVFYVLTALFNAAVKDPAKWEGEVESKWPGFKKLADFMRKSGVDPVETWRALFSLLGHVLKLVAKAAGLLPVAVVALVTGLLTVSGCAAMEAFFTPNRINELGELGACVVPMLESGKPIADIVAVCGPDAVKFVAGYKAGMAKQPAQQSDHAK